MSTTFLGGDGFTFISGGGSGTGSGTNGSSGTSGINGGTNGKKSNNAKHITLNAKMRYGKKSQFLFTTLNVINNASNSIMKVGILSLY